MLNKQLEPNLLNFFDCRQAETCPVFFETVEIPFRYNIVEAIKRWVVENLKGRFYIGKSFSLDNETNSIETVLKIGFEDPKEASYFILACPFLKYK